MAVIERGGSPKEDCPVCGNDSKYLVRAAFDDRYGHPGHFDIVACRCCGHRMTTPRLAEQALGELYSTYYPRRYVDVDSLTREAVGVNSWVAALRRWWSGTNNQGQYSVKRGEKVLDVGCGSGLSLLEAQAFGARAFGIEADPSVRRIADALGLTVHIGSLYDDPFPGEFFDLIVLNQVIEHIPEPAQALSRLSARLRQGGRMVLVFPNRDSLWRRLTGASWINWHVPYHLHHFDAKGFRRLARRCGLVVIKRKTITPNIWTVLQLRALRIPAFVGVPSPMWVVKPVEAPIVSGQVVIRRSALRKLLRKLALGAAKGTLGLVNRLVDAAGYGDSILVELRIERQS